MCEHRSLTRLGRLLLDGFLSLNRDILVPVRRSPCDKHLSVIPCSEAYLSSSKDVEQFLPVPLVPFEIGKNEFFQNLKRRRWIEEITDPIIAEKIRQSVFLLDEFVALLRWLCSLAPAHRLYVKEILSDVRFRDTRQSAIVHLDNVQFYDTLNRPSLPLPQNVLPSTIVTHLSREDLEKRLSLSSLSLEALIDFYLLANQEHLFLTETTSPILLSLLSERWHQCNDGQRTKIKERLSALRCIPTSEGMRCANESYIRSSSLADNVPTILLHVPQLSLDESVREKQRWMDYPVSLEFLKSIGCRTIHLPTLSNVSTSDSDLTTSNTTSVQLFVEELLQHRKGMSDNDLRALKENECLPGQFFDVFTLGFSSLLFSSLQEEH